MNHTLKTKALGEEKKKEKVFWRRKELLFLPEILPVPLEIIKQ